MPPPTVIARVSDLNTMPTIVPRLVLSARLTPRRTILSVTISRYFPITLSLDAVSHQNDPPTVRSTRREVGVGVSPHKDEASFRLQQVRPNILLHLRMMVCMKRLRHSTSDKASRPFVPMTKPIIGCSLDTKSSEGREPTRSLNRKHIWASWR